MSFDITWSRVFKVQDERSTYFGVEFGLFLNFKFIIIIDYVTLIKILVWETCIFILLEEESFVFLDFLIYFVTYFH